MPLDPEGLETFEAAGEKFTAVFGFKAMKAVETHFDKPFFMALMSVMPGLSADDANDPAAIARAAANVRIGDVGKLFEFALVKHHPELTEEAIDELIDEIGLNKAGDVVGKCVAAAMAKGADGKSPANPRSPKRKTG